MQEEMDGLQGQLLSQVLHFIWLRCQARSRSIKIVVKQYQITLGDEKNICYVS